MNKAHALNRRALDEIHRDSVAKHDGGAVDRPATDLFGLCHPKSMTFAQYDPKTGWVWIFCGECRAVVTCIEVAP